MIRQGFARRVTARLLSGVVLALLTAACWWAWMAWDHSYQTDPATGQTSGPYQAWQVIGCVLCLIALCVAASMRLPLWLVLPIMPVAFTLAWSWTAASTDTTGLWGVGASMIFFGMLVGTAMVSGVTAAMRASKTIDTTDSSE